jgi:hypothetical protein
MLRKRSFDPGDEIAAVRFIVGVLKLASPAVGKVPAGRLLMVRPRSECSIVEQRVAWDAERHVPSA